MLAEPFHKTGIAVAAGMLTSHIRINDIAINFGYGEDRFGVNFLYVHALNPVTFTLP
jgi:hypothetical protein